VWESNGLQTWLLDQAHSSELLVVWSPFLEFLPLSSQLLKYPDGVIIVSQRTGSLVAKT
jgi:hypothetical protein